MATRRTWVTWVFGICTLGLYLLVAPKTIAVEGKTIVIKGMFSTKRINADRINSVDTNLIGLKIDLASGRGNQAPIQYSKVVFENLEAVAEAWAVK